MCRIMLISNKATNIRTLHDTLLNWLVQNLDGDEKNTDPENIVVVLCALFGQTSVQTYLASWFPENWNKITTEFHSCLKNRINALCTSQLTVACCRLNDLLEN